MNPLRLGVAGLVVAAMAIAVFGIGMGSAPKSADPAPTSAALTASKMRIANGGPKVAEGRKEFKSGCESCHAIAADNLKGKLGPRLDTDTDPADEILTSITKPREDIVKGYGDNLMPADYGEEIKPDELGAIVAYIKAASGKKKGGGS